MAVRSTALWPQTSKSTQGLFRVPDCRARCLGPVLIYGWIGGRVPQPVRWPASTFAFRCARQMALLETLYKRAVADSLWAATLCGLQHQPKL